MDWGEIVKALGTALGIGLLVGAGLVSVYMAERKEPAKGSQPA